LPYYWALAGYECLDRSDEQVIAKFKTLRDTPSDIDVAVEVLEGYIEAKRRKGRNDGDVTMRLEAIQRAVRVGSPAVAPPIPGRTHFIEAPTPSRTRIDIDIQVPFHLHDAFLFARRQRRLPLASSFTGRMDSSAGLGSGLALGQTEMGEHDYWDMPTLDDFPLPPTHLPGPTFTPARRTAAWSVSTPCTSPAISSPSAWSIDSGSSDEMPLTPGWNSAEGRCRRLDDRAVINADEDDDSRTITGVAVSSDEIVYASRRAVCGIRGARTVH
jgi:hypothetical protein